MFAALGPVHALEIGQHQPDHLVCHRLRRLRRVDAVHVVATLGLARRQERLVNAYDSFLLMKSSGMVAGWMGGGTKQQLVGW